MGTLGLAVSARVSVAYRAIGAALTVRMHRHRILPARGKNIWCRWIRRITAKITWNRLGFGVRIRFPPKVDHEQGKWHRNRWKQRHRNQYRRRYRQNGMPTPEDRQARERKLIHSNSSSSQRNRQRTPPRMTPVVTSDRFDSMRHVAVRRTFETARRAESPAPQGDRRVSHDAHQMAASTVKVCWNSDQNTALAMNSGMNARSLVRSIGTTFELVSITTK